MRVLYVYKDYYPVPGGIENHIKLLAEGLVARRVDVDVLVTNTARNTVREVINGVPVTKAGRLANVSSAPISLELFRLIRDFQPDVAHLHFPYPIGELAQMWRGRARKLVVTYHSDIVRQKNLLRVYKPFLKQLLARADAISLSNPTYIQNSVYVAPHAEKCVVIHHGADLTRFAPTPASQAQAQEIRGRFPGPIVLFVGRLRYYKGVENLILAMREVPAPAHAVIVGTGPMEAEWKALTAQQGLGERITFAGNVADADLPAYYQAAAVFVLPSTHPSETWGSVQIEAMASGTPSICTELGTGTSYVNQDGVTGLVVPPRDPAALAGAIRQLMDDDALRRHMGEAAFARAQLEFSHTTMIDRSLEIYERLLAGKPFRIAPLSE
jgi:rhamnosyl/mannosyltransferase